MTAKTASPRHGIFPERNWKEFDPDGYSLVYERLQKGGRFSSTAIEYLQKHKVKIGFHEQDHSGARWTILRNITLAPDAVLDNSYSLSLIIHEVFHLQQTILTRLSVYGELPAWQFQRQAYLEISGKEIGESGEAFAGKKNLWDEISRLSPHSRDDLRRAQELMKRIAPGYQSDCLPLYPLFKEIWFFLKQGDVRSAISTVYNLITCR